MEEPTLNVCMSKNPAEMPIGELKSCFNNLLLREDWQRELNATDRENLVVVVREDKAGHFIDTLNAFTEIKNVKGLWRDEKGKEFWDKNTIFMVEFKDTKDEKVGERLMELLKEINHKLVDESLLYGYTFPIEESTL